MTGKLSNFVETMAANGSIFTILAISFERYYAICKPLKAGYKCTRLRATIIIAVIWLLSLLLTSPILIMAKSSETIYIDGSLVNNCILETDTYWTKMYVVVSMFAFFCLPLLVLMLVYWMIGRRLIRENIAMASTTTSLATSDSTEYSNATATSATQLPHSPMATMLRKKISLKRAASLKSISTFFSSLHHNHYHHFNLNHQSGELVVVASAVDQHQAPAGSKSNMMSQKPRALSERCRPRLTASKASSLDHHHHHHHLAPNALESMTCQQNGITDGRVAIATFTDLDGSTNKTTTTTTTTTTATTDDYQGEQVVGTKISMPLANQFFRRLFSRLFASQSEAQVMTPTTNSTATTTTPNHETIEQASGFSKMISSGNEHHNRNQRTANSRKNVNVSDHDSEEQDDVNLHNQPFLSKRHQQQQQLNSTQTNDLGQSELNENFINIKAPNSTGRNDEMIQSKRGLNWYKRFSRSSSTASEHTSSTTLPSSELSSHPIQSAGNPTGRAGHMMGARQCLLHHQSPRPILHSSSSLSSHNQANLDKRQRSGQYAKKKIAHFNVDTGRSSTPPTTTDQQQSTSYQSASCSSASGSGSGSNSTPFSSKSPSPDSIFTSSPQSSRLIHHHHQHEQTSESDSRSLLTINTADIKLPMLPTRYSTASDHQHHHHPHTIISEKFYSLAEDDGSETEPNLKSSLSSSHDSSSRVAIFVSKSCDSRPSTQVEEGSQTLNDQVPGEQQQSRNENNRVLVTSLGDDDNNNDENIIAQQSTTKKLWPTKLSVPRKSLDCTIAVNSKVGNNGSTHNHHHHHHHFHFSLRRNGRLSGSHPVVCGQFQNNGSAQLSELLVVQDLSKKQQMDSRRQVVVMLAFVVACFFLLFFPYRVFTIWLIFSTEDQVQSLGMETYYNLTYFSRILIYLHSAINPIAYNLISTKFRRAFMSILLCRGSATRRHFTTEHRNINTKLANNEQRKPLRQALNS